MSVAQGHFWLGNYGIDPATGKLPPNTVSVEDNITFTQDLGNHIPDKSWMIYIFELFHPIPLELDLICQFNNRNMFTAIWNGNNQHYFKATPVLGHTYKREIITNANQNQVIYRLTDITANTPAEIFPFVPPSAAPGTILAGQANDVFNGIEWWDKSTTQKPYPIRYAATVSNFGYSVGSGYIPFTTLTPNSDGTAGINYPVSFSSNPGTHGYSVRPVSSSPSLPPGPPITSKPPPQQQIPKTTYPPSPSPSSQYPILPKISPTLILYGTGGLIALLLVTSMFKK